MLQKELAVNGQTERIVAKTDTPLVEVIRDQLQLTGTKYGCDIGECGTCSVLLNGKVIRSCLKDFGDIPDGSELITIEGIGENGSLHPLQVAWMVHGGAQCGYCTPGYIVSAKGLLDENEDPTREEVRDWFEKHQNLCRCTGYKPLVDAVMDAAKVVRGEMDKEELWPRIPEGASIMGSDYVRPSAKAKVTGSWDFGADLGFQLPEETLHAKLVQADVPHAEIVSIDTSEAEEHPGVHSVLTHEDVEGSNRINGMALEASKIDGFDRPILNDEKVFQRGDPLAIVLAEKPEFAEQAVEKVEYELEELPAYRTAQEAMDGDAMEIHPGDPNVYFENGVVKGEETEPIIDSAPNVVEDDFYTQRVPHMPLEPDVGFAHMNDDGKVVINSKSIALHIHSLMIAEGIGKDPEDVAIVQNNAGATFGYKFEPTIEGLLGVATMATERPVYLEFDMAQQQIYTGKRSPFWTDMRMAADKEGNLQAMESDFTVDHGAYSEWGDLLAIRGAQYGGAGYDIPNIRGAGRTVFTNNPYGAAMRGYGAPQIEFASEVLVDELAEEVGMDPLEFRYQNVYREGSTTPTGVEPDVITLPTLIDQIRPKYEDAKERVAKKNENSDGDERYGVGVSLSIYGSGLDGEDSSEAWVELTEDGAKIGATWEDHGQGADVGALTYAHEALRPLGLDPEDIDLQLNDMRTAPNSGPAAGSRSTVVTGNAIVDACNNLLDAMRKEDGSFRSYEEMVEAGMDLRYSGSWTAPNTECDPETGQGDPFPAYMYGVIMSEVKVDIETGKTEIEKMAMAGDVGVINNKLAVDGQMYGGLAQGVGMALSEEFEDYDKHTTLHGAGFPSITEIPDDIELLYTETERDNAVYGSSGAGEMPLSAPHASIINAIYDATGVRVTHLPARPEKIKEKL